MNYNPTGTPSRQSRLSTRFRRTKGFRKDDDSIRHDNSSRYAGSPPPPQKLLTPNKSLNESTFTASTVILDASMGSSSNEDNNSTTSRSQIASPTNSLQRLDRSMDDVSTPLTPGRESTASSTSSTAGSKSNVSRRSLINRFRKRRQQTTLTRLGVKDEGSNIESTNSPNERSSTQPQHQQLRQPYQLQKTNTLQQPSLGQADSATRQTNQQNTSTTGSSTSSFIKKSNARKILSSKIALRARSRGLFPKTTPQAPRHPQSMPAHPQRQREETETAPTEIMAPTEVMQNLSSARGMEQPNAVMSEAGAPTEIMTNQTRKQTNHHRFRIDPPLKSCVTQQHHALLDDATVTSDQHSVPIKSLFDNDASLQQSSSISTTNSMEKRVVTSMQSPPRAWEDGPKRSLDSLFAKHQDQQRNLNVKYSDDASSCFTEERELDHTAVVQRVFSLDKVDLEQEVPLPLPSLLSTNNTKQVCAQVKPRHPTEVSLALQEPQQVPRGTLEMDLNEIPKGSTCSQENDDPPLEEGLSFFSQQVHPPSMENDDGALDTHAPLFASKRGVHNPSLSKSGSLDGLAFAKSNEDMVLFEDSQDSFGPTTEENPLPVQGTNDLDLYDDLDRLQNSPTVASSSTRSVQGTNDLHLYDDLDRLQKSPTVASPSVQGTNDLHLYDDLDRLQNSPTGSTFMSTKATRTPAIGSYNDIPSLQQQEAVSQPLTPDKPLAFVTSPMEGKSEEEEEGEWKDMIRRYRQRSSDSDKTPTKPTKSNDEPAPTRNVASSPWKEADRANKFAERRSFGSIKDKIKAFDKPQKVWKPPVKGKTWKPIKVASSQQIPSPVSNPSSRGMTVNDEQLKDNYHFEEKKTEEASFSYSRDDDGDTLSVKSMKDVWENRISGNFSAQAEKDDFDIDNDTIRDDDDDDDCASVKSLRDAWEIKFSKDDLENGFNDDLEEDAGTVKSRREELQKRIWDQQGIPVVVSVDEIENKDDLDFDDGNGSVKSLRKRFDTPNTPKRESVNRLRAMFEPSGAAAKSSPARSRSWRANKSPSRASPGRNRSFSSQGSAPRSHGNIKHEDEEDPLRRMAMAWSQKRTEAKRNSLPVAQTQSSGQETSKSRLDSARMEIDEAPDDQLVSGSPGMQPEAKESSRPVNVDMGENVVSPDYKSYRERSAEMAYKDTTQPIRQQGSSNARSTPSMQDRLDRWSSRLKAAKKKPGYVSDSFSTDFSVSDSSMNAASSLDNIGQESTDHRANEAEHPKDPMSMPSMGDARGRSMDTEYSDAVTLDVSIANVSSITDPSSLRTRSQDTLSDVLSSPGRSQLVISPTRVGVVLNEVSEESTPERSSNSMSEASGRERATETISSLRTQRDTRRSPDNGNADPFSTLSEKANRQVKFDDDPFLSVQDQFAIDERNLNGPETSAQDPLNPPKLDERRSIRDDLFDSVASPANSTPASVSSPLKKPNSRLRMVPVIRNQAASSHSVTSEQPVPVDPVKDIPSPKKQRKKVSFKLSDAPSLSSEDSRVTEKTASSSELSSLPPIPSQFDENYEAIMQERHQILMERQRAYKERAAAKQGAKESGWDGTPQVEPAIHSQPSEPVMNRRSLGFRQSRTQMRLFGRTHPIHSSTQKSNAPAVNTTSKATSRSLFSKKAQEQRLAEQSIAPTHVSSTVTTPSFRQPPSKASSRSLFSKKAPQAQAPVTPPRSESTDESRGYGYSPKRTGSPLKAAIPRYHPQSQTGRQQQRAARNQTSSLYSTMVSTLGFGQSESAHDIVARLQSYQSAHQHRPQPPPTRAQPPPLDMDDFADFAKFDSGLEGAEWL